MVSSLEEINFKDISGGITNTPGFSGAGINCGLKEYEKDLALIYSEEEAKLAAVFTKNQVKAAPVVIGERLRSNGRAQALIINSGNANACTGAQGFKDAEEIVELTAQHLGIAPDLVFPASTGVIGETLPIELLKAGIKEITGYLHPAGGKRAARAIMTTDTYPKEIAVTFEIDGQEIIIGGMAKGSGMIEPNMATMLSFLTTNLNISQQLLQEALSTAVNSSFNRITVDGDQSTNDTVAILANGTAGNSLINCKDDNYYKFLGILEEVTKNLAQQIVKDGEGATKFVEIEVINALTLSDAELIARAIANSQLVKTALFGEDPNWGRIVAAAGYSGGQVELDRLGIEINGLKLLVDGQKTEVDSDRLRDLLAQDEINIKVNLNLGQGKYRVWTCDLSYEYVKINAEYHT
ncbi:MULTISPECIES: bifunctional glutamate N-acetyltransferase/amino-acid acetyltransferase ArgJ [unclassified Candidatus Frackibacter]|uniref:bifunctional glutamate N-acetyltransferase/amino-acid acetyltransferase ArgJ n=1 Tax=unclassified Candidatus Frackibacter TaxID=2648818 RepID=UPI000792FDEA|nr:MULTISPECIES: bifunctional glutamate N-acetyltransferase/amino-acid acetyltransferase ArgJ [unclassified Candidatus Frackibacter]KXS41688.1 MAG: glutamate N-acetyltransferase / amino-acid N-acetyltransferase [Candidatus Frackibacter sp. T328-2]SDB97630.1 glutamate N-acetyltransferase [Candidatus Frackibacter sp. WG11]SEM29332.1 glutamate N-acetyltransferase [Candidatus Frackibacter sp. WG12]SFL34211.1 glutamate N-acetyltransferase [Candidatus Frackibacter sp. WG13]